MRQFENIVAFSKRLAQKYGSAVVPESAVAFKGEHGNEPTFEFAVAERQPGLRFTGVGNNARARDGVRGVRRTHDDRIQNVVKGDMLVHEVSKNILPRASGTVPKRGARRRRLDETRPGEKARTQQTAAADRCVLHVRTRLLITGIRGRASVFLSNSRERYTYGKRPRSEASCAAAGGDNATTIVNAQKPATVVRHGCCRQNTVNGLLFTDATGWFN